MSCSFDSLRSKRFGFPGGGPDDIAVNAGNGEIVWKNFDTLALDKYDAVVKTDGTSGFTTIEAAVAAGKKSIFLRNGTYTLSTSITLTDNMQIIGESRDGVILNCAGGGKFISYNNGAAVDGDYVPYGTGTISFDKGSNVITGSGTTFVDDGVQVNEYIEIGGFYYKITAVSDNLSLTVERSFVAAGSPAIANQKYRIVAGFVKNVRIANLTFSQPVYRAIAIAGARNLVIENCVVLDATNTTDFTGIFTLNDIEDSIVRDCSMDGGVSFILAQGAVSTSFTNLRGTNNSSRFFALYYSRYCHISNMHTNSVFRGIDLLTTDDCTFDNLQFYNNELYGIQAGTGSGICYRLTFTNLVMYNIDRPFLRLANASISNCIVEGDVMQWGFYIQDGNVNISNCRFVNCSGNPIYALSTASNISISNCYFSACNSLRFLGSNNYVTITGCVFRSAVGYAIDTNTGNVHISNCSISESITGGITSTAQDLKITNCDFEQNAGAHDIYVQQQNQGNLVIMGNNFQSIITPTNANIEIFNPSGTQNTSANICNNVFQTRGASILTTNTACTIANNIFIINDDTANTVRVLLPLGPVPNVIINGNNVYSQTLSSPRVVFEIGDATYNITNLVIVGNIINTGIVSPYTITNAASTSYAANLPAP